MTRSNDKRIDDLFQAALDLPEPERNDFLKNQCRDEPTLIEEVRALLDEVAALDDHSDESLSGVRDRLLTDVIASDNDTENLSGRTIGHWQVRRRIARGGLATVYIADRNDGEFQQKAALKVLRRGLDTDDLILRFRAERQILSSLDHPSIAAILDGGALPDGRPYLVLEFIEGAVITDYCSKAMLSVPDKVRLLIEVLRALHHAHTHLVVHRDVKPSNILVTEEGNVSLLDFGIAKILDPATMPGASTATRTGISLLTPGYGSPEQHAGAPITTASDIYQCGLLLYELLTGQPVFRDGRRPTGPLIASSALAGKPEYKSVRGDLDAIINKALDGDPSQRYASADEMLLDLQRFLSGRPILAGPSSVVYRFGKLAKRRPWLFPAIGIAMLVMVAYVATITTYSKRLAEEERLAIAAQQFLVDLFRSPDPFNPADASAGSNITVVQALEIGRERIATELADQPRLQASLLGSIADVYGSLDRSDDAITLRKKALSLEQEQYGDESPQVAETLRQLTPLLRNAGLAGQATESAARQLSLAETLHAADSAEVGLAKITAGIDAYFSGEVLASRELIATGINILRPYRRSYPNEMINALIIYAQNLGFDRTDTAFAAIEEADNIAEEIYGAKSLQRASAQIRLASSLTLFEEFAASEKNFREALPILEEQLGRDHSSSVVALSNFAFLMASKGDDERAESLYKDLLERQVRLFGSDSRAVADTNQNLGAIYSEQGRFDEAVPALARAHEIYSVILNDDNYVIAFPLLTLAYAKIQLGQEMDAEAVAREALQRFEKTLPDTHLVGVARCLVGVALERQGLTDEGTKLIEQSRELLRKGNIPEHYQVLCRYSP